MGKLGNKNNEKQIGISIRSKIIILVLFAVVLTIGICIWNSLPLMKRTMLNISESYMQDVCDAKRNSIQVLQEQNGESITQETLVKEFQNVSLRGMKTSYLYMVSRDGIMLYHPTESKIGVPVENAVIKSVVAEIANGQKPEDGMATYDFRGTEKYAVYCLTKDQSIVVLSVDKSDFMSPIDQMMKRNLIGGIAIILIFTPICIILLNKIVNPIQYLSKLLIQLSTLNFKRNDKLKKICNRKDECGLIGRAVNQLSNELETTIKEIHNDGVILNNAAKNMYGIIDNAKTSIDQVDQAIIQIAKGATQQAGDMQEATSNISEMGSMIELVGKKIDEATVASNNMLQLSEDAMKVLDELESKNNEVQDNINEVSEQTNDTNKAVQKIQAAANIITEIAAQTNLLSLNASIEAARAGEAGKGFSVVANEIKQLADQSHQSASEIQNIVDLLINESKQVITTMEKVSSSMIEQNKKVVHTDKQFSCVNNDIDISNKSIKDIDERTKDIDKRRGEIIDIVSGLSALAEENAASTQETSAAIVEVNQSMDSITNEAANLERLSNKLKEQFDRFLFN